MDRETALSMCADLVLRCAGGDLTASKFVVVHASPLIARMFEDDLALDVDDAGRQIVPIPGVTEAFLRPAVEWLHGARDCLESIDGVVRVLDGLDFLGVERVEDVQHLRDRHWDLVRVAGLPVLAARLSYLLHTPRIQEALERLMQLVPMWVDARPLVRALPTTPSIAPTVTRVLARHYPANLVFHEILDVLQNDRAATIDDFLRLLGSSGTHYLPPEIPSVLDHLASALSSRPDPPDALVGFLKNAKLALEVFDVVPHAPRNGVQGASIAFHHTPVCTLVADISDLSRARVARRKLAPWLTAELDFAQASPDATRVRASGIDDPLAKNATCFEVRLMAIDPRTRSCAELWFCFEHVSPQDWVALGAALDVRGDRAAFRRAFASPAHSHLRFDVFFGALSPLRAAAPPADVASAVEAVSGAGT